MNRSIQNIEHQYARVATGDNIEQAINELKGHLREHIVWERNMVWREMVGQERRRQSVMLDEAKPSAVRTPFGTVQIDRDQALHTLFLVASMLVFAILLRSEIFPQVEQNRCFAILVLASMLWAGEVRRTIQEFWLLTFQGDAAVCHCPAGAIFNGGFARHALRRRSADTSQRTGRDQTCVCGYVFPVIMLLLGGFAIAGALSKFGIAKSMATFVLSKAGTRPSRVLLVNMLVATIASMWISNVAAPVLCFTIIQVTSMDATINHHAHASIFFSLSYGRFQWTRGLGHA